jgi:predicted metal-dependent hydrolase
MAQVRIDSIISSKRKTISLEVGRRGGIIIRAPEDASATTIRRELKRKKLIIPRSRLSVRKHADRSTEADLFMYLGRRYRVFLVDNPSAPLVFDGRRFLLDCRQFGERRSLLMEWYRKMAITKISQRVRRLSRRFGIAYNKITITDANRRWGSLSIRGNLNFGWRLVMAPPLIIDYIILHELAHFEEYNHSADFWNHLAGMLPDFGKRMEWLRDHGHLLDF